MSNIINIKDNDNKDILLIKEKVFTVIYDINKNSMIYNCFYRKDSELNIYMNNKKVLLNSLYSKKNNIEVHSNLHNKLLLSNTVLDNLIIKSNTLELNTDKIIERFNKLLKMYNLDTIINKKIIDLSYGVRKLISLLILVAIRPKVLVVDDILYYLDKNNADITINLLNKLNSNGTTIIYFTNDINNILISNEYIIIKDNKIIINSSKKNMNEDVNKFTDNDIKLPFIVDLSKKLRYYNTINNVYVNMDELVNELWVA